MLSSLTNSVCLPAAKLVHENRSQCLESLAAEMTSSTCKFIQCIYMVHHQ